MEYKIPLRNKNKEITNYVIVSEEDYDILNSFKWCSSKGYVYGKINNKYWYIHRYIMIIILKNDIDSYTFVDHIDNNPLNNTRNNLRLATPSENSRNKNKNKGKSSEYIGVSLINNRWRSTININKKVITASYLNEHHAAHQYNLWCKEYNLTTAKLNKIPDNLLMDFILFKTPTKLGNDLPKYISLKNNKYLVRIKRKIIGLFDNIEDAILAKNNKLIELELENINKIKQIPILKNKNNECIIEIFNNKKEKICETIVDEDIYYDLIRYKWNCKDNYIRNFKKGFLHRYIMNYEGKDFIDHINNNPLDNRKKNLRIVTVKQNNMNKQSKINSSSKYIGVCWNKSKNKWTSSINYNSKRIHIGHFNDEIEAAKARDIATIKYYKEFGNLNFTNDYAV
jgi:hypothetical protein